MEQKESMGYAGRRTEETHLSSLSRGAVLLLCAGVLLGIQNTPAFKATIDFRPGSISQPVPDASRKAMLDRAFATVKAYADAMLKDGTDKYGAKSSPLIASCMVRTPVRLPKDTGEISAIADIRRDDRSPFGGNPMHDENLYRLLYALSQATGDPKYAAGADASLKWFFENTQHSVTGFVAWGEHLYWDFYTENVPTSGGNRNNHEYYRPWLLWERSYALAPQAVKLYAQGVWNNQIGNKETGDFSRHAGYTSTKGGTGADFQRHAGFYIRTWAQVHALSPDPIYLKAMDILVKRYESQYNAGDKSKNPYWPFSWLSLSLDLEKSAQALEAKGVAGDLPKRMHTLCHKINLWLRLDSGPDWGGGYGGINGFAEALISYDLYRDTKDTLYSRRVIRAADKVLNVKTDPSIQKLLFPGGFGNAIFLLQGAYKLTGDRKYLDRADQVARWGLDYFWKSDSPLPRATSQHNHYETIGRSETLALALLSLWLGDRKGGDAWYFEGVDR